MLGEIGGRKRKGWQRMRWLGGITNSMDVSSHFWVNSRRFDGQGGLACYSAWGHKELDTTEPLNWTEETTIERKTFQNFEQFWMKEYLFFKLRYCWFTIICLFKVYSKVIQWFSLSGASLDKIHSLWETREPCPQLRTAKNPEFAKQHVVVLEGVFRLNKLF